MSPVFESLASVNNCEANSGNAISFSPSSHAFLKGNSPNLDNSKFNATCLQPLLTKFQDISPTELPSSVPLERSEERRVGKECRL